MQYGKGFFFKSADQMHVFCKSHVENIHDNGWICIWVHRFVCVWTWQQIGYWFLPQRARVDRDYFNPTVVAIICIDYSWTPEMYWSDPVSPHSLGALSLYFSLSLFFFLNKTTKNRLRLEELVYVLFSLKALSGSKYGHQDFLYHFSHEKDFKYS